MIAAEGEQRASRALKEAAEVISGKFVVHPLKFVNLRFLSFDHKNFASYISVSTKR